MSHPAPQKEPPQPAFILEITDDACSESDLYVFEREIDAYQGLAYDALQRSELYGIAEQHEEIVEEVHKLYDQGDYLGAAKIVRERPDVFNTTYRVDTVPMNRVFNIEAFPYVHLTEAKDD